MSLLVDARKKSQQANGYATSADELRLEEHSATAGGKTDPIDDAAMAREAARTAGQKLFDAKSPLTPGRSPLNPKLLMALGGTMLLVASGVGYLWYLDSSSTTAPLRPVAMPPPGPVTQARPIIQAEPATQAQPATATEPVPQDELVPGIDTQIASRGAPKEKAQTPAAPPASVSAPTRPAHASEPPHQDDSPIRIEQQQMVEQVDPLLLDAYSAYQRGKLEQAQQLYLELFRKDARNIDVLLGLAAIAQQQGNSMVSAQYYARILELDPRNAAANAGMSALGTDDENIESRLKNLLREQGNAAALHFALGNLYAGQSRWGEAQQAYFNAYTLEPGNPEFAFNLAVSLDHLGQGQLALQHYRRALKFDPSHRAGFDHAQVDLRIKELTH